MKKSKLPQARAALFLIVFFVSALFTSTHAAYLSLGESGEVIPESTFQVGAAPQVITNGDGGFNVAAFLDAGWTDSFSSRFMLGAGEVDFYVSGSAKWIPFPDVDRQPAMGLKLSLWYAREGSSNINTIQLLPMVSKKYPTDNGIFIPYAAYGISNYSIAGSNKTGDQFFIGSDWKNPDFGSINVTGEIATSLKDSTSSISIFASIPFDNKKGFGSK